MFGIGSTELVVILLVALIVLGPKSLAGIACTMGKVMGEFRRVSTDFQRTLNAESAQEEEAERKRRPVVAGDIASPKDSAAATSSWTDAAGESEAPVASSPPSPPLGSMLAGALAKTGTEAAAKAAPEKALSQEAYKGSVV
ncbi:MAG: twin-arginine translocase TatA/TatE family subunit [Desulfovibrio sp.]|jgi:sec-independent protein translocase protein TatB|nr:twin-arginine translocase TatA/TatE family subunit [Desulfovibrio sp.]